MPDDPQNPDKLNDDQTFVGERDTPPEFAQSLGDQATAGDALSSISDFSSDTDDLGDAMPLVDLAERYEIQDVLGKGGMGEVLRALDTRLKRPVAIKRVLGEMARSTKALSRFLTEAQSIAALNHFNIVQIYDYGRDAEGPFIIMELVEGESLQEKLKAGPLELKEAIDLTCQLCDGLAVAHGSGIVHRDIKPANILLTARGEPKLTDFGLARQDSVDHGQTQAGAVLGTIDFMPPEQRQDATATDGRSDLWALAATFYQMITGKSPKIIKFTKVPQALQDVLEKALEDAPEDRYQTAQEFRDAFKGVLATTAGPAPEVAADLGAGECPACHTRNEASRKFCSECATLLRVPCMACKEEIPIWDKVCGQCGGKQPELVAAHRDELSGMIEKSLTLSREYEYEKALSQLETVAGDKHVSTEDLRKQAAEQIEIITPQRDEQYQLRDQLVELANQHQQIHDYGAVVRELEKIPAPLRSGNEIAKQLSNATAERDELASLDLEIRDDITNKRIDGLLEKTARFLELNPGHEKIHELHEKLLQRQQKADRRARLEELVAGIKAATTAVEKLPLVEEYLQLRPDDKHAQQLARSLPEQIQAEQIQSAPPSVNTINTAKMKGREPPTTTGMPTIVTNTAASTTAGFTPATDMQRGVTGQGTLCFKRNTGIVGMMMKIKVFVDGQLKAKLGMNGTAQVVVSLGQHKIEIKGGGAFHGDKALVNVTDNSFSHYSIKYSALGGLKLIFQGAHG